jgi:hypothetical protein
MPAGEIHYPTYSATAQGFVADGGYTAYTPFGYKVLQVGWFGIVFGMLAWYSNILALIAFICAKANSYRAGMFLSVAAFLLALQTFTLRTVPTDLPDLGNCKWIDAKCGVLAYLGIGFYIWLASFIVLAFYCYSKVRHSLLPHNNPIP